MALSTRREKLEALKDLSGMANGVGGSPCRSERQPGQVVPLRQLSPPVQALGLPRRYSLGRIRYWVRRSTT